MPCPGAAGCGTAAARSNSGRSDTRLGQHHDSIDGRRQPEKIAHRLLLRRVHEHAASATREALVHLVHVVSSWWPPRATKTPSVKYSGGSTAQSAASRARCRFLCGYSFVSPNWKVKCTCGRVWARQGRGMRQRTTRASGAATAKICRCLCAGASVQVLCAGASVQIESAMTHVIGSCWAVRAPPSPVIWLNHVWPPVNGRAGNVP